MAKPPGCSQLFWYLAGGWIFNIYSWFLTGSYFDRSVPYVVAGVALYTDHKPGLFENSLSNKGQLSAWRIAETADLQSLVQTHYRQGSKMLLADPLSRLCSPSSGFFDPSLPAKLQALLGNLPESIKTHENVRVYAYKDTAALSRHVQQWRS